MSMPQDMELSLQKYEKTIKEGLKTCFDVGEALMAIKEKKLYKVSHSNFGDYCKERWGFTQQYAGRLITGSTIVKKIKSETTVSCVPQAESQTRSLSKSKNPAVEWKKVQESCGKEQPTAKEIEAYQQKKDDTDTFDAEIIEDDTIEIEAGTNTAAFLTDMIDTPYEMGSQTDRPQVSVGVDDASVARLEQLKDHLHVPKASVVAQALLLMEKVLELQDQPTSNPSS